MQGPEPGRPSVSIPEFRALTGYRKIAQAIAASNRTPTPQSALSYSALNIVYLLPCSYRRKETHDGSLLRFPGMFTAAGAFKDTKSTEAPGSGFDRVG